jgi:pimeloyl-ACP methyl ester carboxylesterase
MKGKPVSSHLSQKLLSYDAAGSGEKALLFLHGVAGDRSEFVEQLKYFSTRYRAISLDLRGHGNSPHTGPFSIGQFAEDVALLCNELNISQVVAIGHSMGSFVALELAVRHPGILKSAVLIDMPAFFSAEVQSAMQPIAESLHGPNYTEAIVAFASQAFFHPADDPQRKQKILNRLSKFPREIFLPLFDEMGRYNLQGVAQKVKIPLLYIHGITPTDINLFRSQYEGLNTAQVALSGHYAHLEVPDQVNAMIERFLSKTD